MLFQSTFPRGERPEAEKTEEDKYNISIHVPAWGTTEEIDGTVMTDKISIHVPAWGTTEAIRVLEEYVNLFQSTFPRGERPSDRV